VLCIGVSTGGPETLKTILKDISPSIKIPIVIVQHMPEFFTAKLAEHLTTICPLPVFESFEGQILEGGKIYLAKGNYHTTLKRESGEVVIHLDQGDKVCYVRPAVDLMFKSIGEVYGQLAFPIILTGMGSDGLNGCRFLKEVGCPIVIQDEESSVVWGMPGAVAEAEIQTNVVTLDNMAEIINKVCA
ncbi:MAG: chemotaxis protein CheB, partial [Halobacteriovoraceae bacterium]|nr:chemotaxis protein CheB [Halobacteriovoraceae bacterium]